MVWQNHEPNFEIADNSIAEVQKDKHIVWHRFVIDSEATTQNVIQD